MHGFVDNFHFLAQRVSPRCVIFAAAAGYLFSWFWYHALGNGPRLMKAAGTPVAIQRKVRATYNSTLLKGFLLDLATTFLIAAIYHLHPVRGSLGVCAAFFPVTMVSLFHTIQAAHMLVWERKPVVYWAIICANMFCVNWIRLVAYDFLFDTLH